MDQIPRGRIMLSACQIRAARAMLSWSIEEAARRSGVSERTIRRLEKIWGVPNATADTFDRLQACFEAEGLEFLADSGGAIGPGIRWGNYPGRQLPAKG